MSLLLILFIFKSVCRKGGGRGVPNTHTHKNKSVHRFYSTTRENVKFNFLIAICNMFYFYKERKTNSINIITQREQQRQHGEPTASAAASAAAAHTSFHSFRTSAASCLSLCMRACVCVCAASFHLLLLLLDTN